MQTERLNEMQTERLEERLAFEIRHHEEFLSVTAHELRTPITAMKLNLRLLERAIEKQTDPTGRLRSVEKSIQDLERQLERLMDVARLEAGTLQLERKAIDLCTVVRDLVARLEPLSQDSGSPIRITGDGVIRGQWDGRLLDLLISNIVTNALKFGRGAPILINLGEEAGWARIEVQDQGPGVPRELRERVFERFVTTQSDRNRKGAGLGLWIVRELTLRHGGEVHIEEGDHGIGTRVVVRLPTALEDGGM